MKFFIQCCNRRDDKDLEFKPIIENNQNNNNNENILEDLVIVDPSLSNMNLNFKNNLSQIPYILELEVINSSCFESGKKIQINSNGLINDSLRNKKDNITYFGYTENIKITNQSENDSLDFIIPLKHTEKSGRFFKIEYIPKINEYCIKDLGKGLGTFIKIQDYMYIRDNSMINIGDSYLTFLFGKDFNNNEIDIIRNHENNNINGKNMKVKIKLYGKNKENSVKEHIFNCDEKKIIHIGRRNHKNEIELDDNLSSKINCIILYDNEKGWLIKDGNEIILENGDIQRSYSTNGTWILAVENTKIIDGMIFKSNFNIFKCNLLKP